EHALQLAHAVAKARGETRHAIAIDDAVADQAHRACDHVGAPVPLGRARGRIGTTALARPEAGLLRRGGRGVEAHVLALGRHRWTARPAVDASRGHRREEPPVKAGVPGAGGLVATLEILDHLSSVTDPQANVWRYYDIAV